MNVELIRVDDAFHFEAKGSSESIVHIDAAEAVGGSNSGVRPMELLLMGVAGCSAIDVISILKKQKQEITDFKISVGGERIKEENTERKPFSTIEVHFQITGINLDASKAEKAIKLSMEKYCSATAQFEGSTTITHKLTVLEA
jgi:putative redox protein